MSNRIESVFDEVAAKISPKSKDITSLKAVLENCQLQTKSVLEVGCGIGDNLIYCAQKGAGYTEGFDISSESIKLARSKAEGLPNVIFHKRSLKGYKTERRFDFILGWGVFEYLQDPLESLKKIRRFLRQNKGTLILLISRPIFIKRISFLFRAPLSKVPIKALLPTAKLIGKFLKLFNSIFNKTLFMGNSSGYSIEQTIVEALMVPRYNVFHHRIFIDYLKNEGFSVELFNDLTPSMVCIVARQDKKTTTACPLMS